MLPVRERECSRPARGTLEDTLEGHRSPGETGVPALLPAARGPPSALGTRVSGSCSGPPVRALCVCCGWTAWRQAFRPPELQGKVSTAAS